MNACFNVIVSWILRGRKLCKILIKQYKFTSYIFYNIILILKNTWRKSAFQSRQKYLAIRVFISVRNEPTIKRVYSKYLHSQNTVTNTFQIFVMETCKLNARVERLKFGDIFDTLVEKLYHFLLLLCCYCFHFPRC